MLYWSKMVRTEREVCLPVAVMKGLTNKGIPGAVIPTWHHDPKLCILLSVKSSLISAAIKETEELSTLPLSPHPVGLITTSFSLLQPLRKARFRKQKCTRRVIWHLWTVTLWRSGNVAAASARSFRHSGPLHISAVKRQRGRKAGGVGGLSPLGSSPCKRGRPREAETAEAFQMDVYLGENSYWSSHVSMYFLFYFLFTFPVICCKNTSLDH